MPRSKQKTTIASLKANLTALASFLGTEISDLNRRVDDLASHVGRDAADQTCHNSAVGTDLTNLFTQVKQLQDWYLKLESQQSAQKIGALEARFNGVVQNRTQMNERVTQLGALVECIQAQIGRLIDHVNREIGVAQDTPLHQRLDFHLENHIELDKQPVSQAEPRGTWIVDSVELNTTQFSVAPELAPGFYTWNVVLRRKDVGVLDVGWDVRGYLKKLDERNALLKLPAEITKYIVARTITAAVTLVYEQNPELSGAYVVVDCWRD
jgi:hypothetical protein